MKKLLEKSVNILCFVFLVVLIFNPLLNLKAAEVIDPDNYTVTIGRVENSKGKTVITRENGEDRVLKQGDLLFSENVIEYIENIDDRDCINDGFKKIEETFIFKTDSDSELTIILDDYQLKNGILTIGADTEIEASIKGGCVYASDNDAEGFDYKTLRWRHRPKYIYLKINKGKVRLFYEPDYKTGLFSIRMQTDNFNKNRNMGYGFLEKAEVDFEMEVKLDKFENMSYDSSIFGKEAREQALKDTLAVLLIAQNAESIDDLDPNIKVEIEKQMAEIKAQYDSMNTMIDESQKKVITIIKMYKNQLKFSNQKVKTGEMVVIEDGSPILVTQLE